MSFKDIRGQDRAVSFLKNSMRSGRISHAYIFHGPGGVGKKLTALNFAKAINCTGESDDKPCDICVSCRKADSRNHPDLLILKPEKEGAVIGMDGIRTVIKDIGLKPYGRGKKIYIIEGADDMREDASSALLKTLEEPPSDSVLILIADNLGALLPTIASRSQTVKFFALNIGEVKGILSEIHGLDPAKANMLSYISSGRPGEALKYNNTDFFTKREKVIAGLAGGTFFESDFDKLSKSDLRIYLDILLTWYRDILVTKTAGAGEAEVVNVDKKEAILSEAARTGFNKLDNMIRQIVSTYSFVEQNVNPRLAMAALGMSA